VQFLWSVTKAPLTDLRNEIVSHKIAHIPKEGWPVNKNWVNKCEDISYGCLSDTNDREYYAKLEISACCVFYRNDASETGKRQRSSRSQNGIMHFLVNTIDRSTGIVETLSACTEKISDVLKVCDKIEAAR